MTVRNPSTAGKLSSATLCAAMSVALLGCMCGESQAQVELNRPVPDLQVGPAFRKALAGRISATWQNVELRTILRRISSDQEVAILLDRRIDPNQKPHVQWNNTPLLIGLEQLAASISVGVSVVGNTIYIGPAESAAKLRTLVVLRSAEVFGDASEVPSGRQFKLADRRSLHWNDLDTPAELLQQIATRYELKIDGAEQIPHDLWAGWTVPMADATEALSLVLVQFDLTFAWGQAGQGIRLVPTPEHVDIERSYTPRGMTPQLAATRWAESISGLRAVPGDKEVLVRGTVEQHEAVEALLRPGRRTTVKPVANDVPPLERREFTLKVQAVPVSAIMQKLAESGIEFEYDAAVLKAAGVDLNQRIDLDVKQARADEFLRAMFGPLGVRFSYEKLTVTLTPQ